MPPPTTTNLVISSPLPAPATDGNEVARRVRFASDPHGWPTLLRVQISRGVTCLRSSRSVNPPSARPNSPPSPRSSPPAGSRAPVPPASGSRSASPPPSAPGTRSPPATAARRCTWRCSALGVKPGDEVVVADYTFPATGHAVMWTGANPVFADVRPDIWTVDPAAVEAADHRRAPSASSPSTRSASPPTTTSCAPSPTGTGLWLIEDAACSAGATYKGRPAGSLADLAAFSFHGRKGITAGEGGALRHRPRGPRRARPQAAHLRRRAGALSRAELSAPADPDLHRAGLQLPALRRGRGDHDRPARPAAGPAGREAAHRRPLRRAAQGPRADHAPRTRPRTATTPGSPTSSPSTPRSTGARSPSSCAQRGVQCTFGTYASHTAAALRPDRTRARSRRTCSPGTWRSRCTPTSPTPRSRPSPPRLVDVVASVAPPAADPPRKDTSAMSKQTVFFTGGAGFIGLHVVPMLLEKGYRVRIFDNMFRGDRDAVAALAGHRRRRADRPGRPLRRRRARGHEGLRVRHPRWPPSRSTRASPTRYESIDINMVGNHNVFAAAADHGVERLVFCSSASVYGDPEKLPMHEDDRARPADPVLHLQARRRGPARLLPAPRGPVVDRPALLQRLRPRPEDRPPTTPR